VNDRAIVLPGYLTETALRLPEDLTFDEWAATGDALARMHLATLWWIGDWLCYGERRYGQMYDDALALKRWEYNTLAHAKLVAAAFEFWRRRQNLFWSHHREVAPLPAPLADRFLDLAEEKHWSQKELRRQIKRGLPSEDDGVLILPPSAELRDGDFRDVMKTLAPGSVDVVITDPPYPREYLPLYGDLAELSARVLRPGGSLLVMIGQSYLPDILKLMTPHVRYHWTVAYLTPGAHTQLWDREVMTGWKPVLWFTAGDYDGEWVYDIAKSEADDKRFHDWGQSTSGMTDLVTRFSREGDLVVDPFLGGGTTGLVAVTLGRRFLGCDVDADAVAVARQRLAERPV